MGVGAQRQGEEGPAAADRPPPPLTHPHQENSPQGKEEVYSRGPKWKTNFGCTTLCMASEPPPLPLRGWGYFATKQWPAGRDTECQFILSKPLLSAPSGPPVLQPPDLAPYPGFQPPVTPWATTFVEVPLQPLTPSSASLPSACHSLYTSSLDTLCK